MHHAGKDHQLFLAPMKTPMNELIMVAIFDSETSLGIVQLFFDQLGDRVAAMPEFQHKLQQTTQQTFERDLEAGLHTVLKSEA